MITNDKIRDGKLQYDINREAAEASALSPGKIDKYEYLTSEEMLCSNKRQLQNKLRFHILHQKNKQKRLKSKGKNKQMLLEIETKDWWL